MNEYELYQMYIEEIPAFLYKYLNLDIMQRLKDISVLCGMDYASKQVYDFKYYLSRYNHSLNVALITWKLTHDKTQTLAALFHDISTPVFSHVIDYMNKDYVQQESTEQKTGEILKSSKELLEYLKEDNIDINDVINFKQYRIVDASRPALCADRVDNLIGVGMSWVKELNLADAIYILDNLTVGINNNKQNEIAVKQQYVASYLQYINKQINKLTHSYSDKYMMLLLSDIVKLTIDDGIVTYEDLFRLTEHEYLSIIEDNLSNYELSDLYNTWKTTDKVDMPYDIKVKELTLDPLVCEQ